MDSSSGAGSGGSDPTTTTPAAAGSSAANEPDQQPAAPAPAPPPPPPSRYESQKRRDWSTFQQYLRNHNPPLTLERCGGAHVVEFLKYLDQFGKTKIHSSGCPYFGDPSPPALCVCPLRQAWGSLDALIGRLRAAYDESGGQPEGNPFATSAVRIYLREVREAQAKARGIPYETKKRKRSHPQPPDRDGDGGDGGDAAAGGSGGGGTGASSSGGAVAAQ